jgi:hypothetical protein
VRCLRDMYSAHLPMCMYVGVVLLYCPSPVSATAGGTHCALARPPLSEHSFMPPHGAISTMPGRWTAYPP